MRNIRDKDFLINQSLRLVTLGMFTLPMLAFRVGSNLSLSDAIFIAAALLCFLSSRHGRLPTSPGWTAGTVLMVIGGITASLFAVSFFRSALVVIEVLYVFVIWTWLFRSVLTTANRFVHALDAYMVGTGVSALVAIAQSRLHILGHLGTTGSGNRAPGLTNQPNLAGVTFALAIAFGVGLILQNGYGKWFYRPVTIGIIVIALVFTGSVSGMLSALAGVLIIVVRRGIKIRTLVTVGLGVVLLYAASVSLLGTYHGQGENLNPFARFQAATTQGSGSDTVSVRNGTLSVSWAGIVNSPFWGHGIDQVSGAIYYDPYLGVYYPAHNFFVLLWYQGGLLYLAGASIAIVSAFRRLVGRRNREWQRDVVFGGAVTVFLFAMQGPELVDRWFWLPFVMAMSFHLGRRNGIGRASRPMAIDQNTASTLTSGS